MALSCSRVAVCGKVWFDVSKCGSFIYCHNARNFSNFFRPRRNNLLLLSLVGIGAGAFMGAGYSYNTFRESLKPMVITEKEIPRLSEFPKVEVSREVRYPNYSTDLRLSVFQYATCPFCCKVRAFLDYYGISYDVIEVNPVMRKQIKWSHYKKVPIVIAQNENNIDQLNDSSMIVSALSTFFMEKDSNLFDVLKFYPTVMYKEDGYEKTEILNRYFLMCQDKDLDEKTKEALALERKWRKWVDDTFVHVLSPNVYRTKEEAFETFHWFSKAGDWEKHFSEWERTAVIYVGAYAMWFIGKRLKKRHNLKDDVRQSFYDECNYWMNAIQKQGTPFMGGNQPNLADLAVYGVLNSVEGSGAFKDVLKNTKLGKWYWTMKDQVNNHAGSGLFER